MKGASEVLAVLFEGRRREKAQALFYRLLAAEALTRDRAEEVDRLNELHADEQHHLSRLTARLIELGGTPDDLRDVEPPRASIDAWETVARAREGEEVRWYEEVLEGTLDAETRQVIREILDSEVQHRRELGGKWMSA